MMIHDLDMLRYLSGAEVAEVYAQGAVLIDPAIGEAGDVDTATVSAKLSNGALALIDNSRKAVYGYDQRAEAFGSKGSIQCENDKPSTAILSTVDGVCTQKPLWFFLERYMEAYKAEIRSFVDCIKSGSDPEVGFEDGEISIRISLACKNPLPKIAPSKSARYGLLSFPRCSLMWMNRGFSDQNHWDGDRHTSTRDSYPEHHAVPAIFRDQQFLEMLPFSVNLMVIETAMPTACFGCPAGPDDQQSAVMGAEQERPVGKIGYAINTHFFGERNRYRPAGFGCVEQQPWDSGSRFRSAVTGMATSAIFIGFKRRLNIKGFVFPVKVQGAVDADPFGRCNRPGAVRFERADR